MKTGSDNLMAKRWPCGHVTGDTVTKHECVEGGSIYVREEHDPLAYSASLRGKHARWSPRLSVSGTGLKSALDRLRSRTRTRGRVPAPAVAPAPAPGPVFENRTHDLTSPTAGLLNAQGFVMAPPSPANALRLFDGQWSSRFPPPWGDLPAGKIPLFEDARISWLNEVAGVKNKTVLELGPLEGGHTYMLESLGASAITSVEASARAYLRCLVTKEVLGLTRARFLLGDFVAYLRASGDSFDIAVASGVLYHMENPAELIALLASHCAGHVLLWTHYYDGDLLAEREDSGSRFGPARAASFGGFDHTLYEFNYNEALNWSGFCGGGEPRSAWMSRSDIIACLAHNGFGHVQIEFDSQDHPNGPAFGLIASRER